MEDRRIEPTPEMNERIKKMRANPRRCKDPEPTFVDANGNPIKVDNIKFAIALINRQIKDLCSDNTNDPEMMATCMRLQKDVDDLEKRSAKN